MHLVQQEAEDWGSSIMDNGWIRSNWCHLHVHVYGFSSGACMGTYTYVAYIIICMHR